MPSLTDRSTLARLAAHVRWSREPDRAAATAPGLQAAADRFLRQARELHPDGDEELIRKAAENLRSAHAIRAARARWDRQRRPSSEAGDAE
jgi:hypothetical protein